MKRLRTILPKNRDYREFSVVLISLYGIENGGIRHISSLLGKNGFKVYIIFFKKWLNNNIKPPTKLEKEKLITLLLKIRPKIVGLSFGCSYFEIVRDITKKIKASMNTIVIWGGIYPTVVPEKCISYTDMICRGEGELPMLELASNLVQNKSVRNIKNLWIADLGRVVKNPIRELIQDLDLLPIRDFSNENKYFIENNKIKKGDPVLKSAEFRILASRGCPFSCSYCYNSILKSIYSGKGKYCRIRSVENVIKELEYAKHQFYKLRRVKFDDDTFSPPIVWIEEFCYKYREKINIPFDILLNSSVADFRVLKMLKGAGLRRIQLGIQSGSKRESREVYYRTSKNAEIIKFAMFNKELKFDVVYDIILDNPLSTRKDKDKLMTFLLNLPRPFKIFLYSLTIFPKTKLTELLLKKRLITEEDIEGKNTKALRQFRFSFYYPNHSKEDIFVASIIMLMTINFIPKSIIHGLSKVEIFRRHPLPLKKFSQICNLFKMLFIGFQMLARDELTIFKVQEYMHPRSIISQ